MIKIDFLPLIGLRAGHKNMSGDYQLKPFAVPAPLFAALCNLPALALPDYRRDRAYFTAHVDKCVEWYSNGVRPYRGKHLDMHRIKEAVMSAYALWTTPDFDTDMICLPVNGRPHKLTVTAGVGVCGFMSAFTGDKLVIWRPTFLQ
jgi:hypothetical protein